MARAKFLERAVIVEIWQSRRAVEPWSQSRVMFVSRRERKNEKTSTRLRGGLYHATIREWLWSSREELLYCRKRSGHDVSFIATGGVVMRAL